MVEAIANSVEDRLIDGLSFKLAPGASYVTDRRSVTYHPQGSNIYKPLTGTKLIRFNLTGDSWLDPSTLRFSYTLKNNSATEALRPIGGPWAFFRRMRILAGGQIIEKLFDSVVSKSVWFKATVTLLAVLLYVNGDVVASCGVPPCETG